MAMENPSYRSQAETLGLVPGIWPDRVPFLGRMFFRTRIERTAVGKVVYVEYVDRNNGDSLWVQP